MNYAKIKHYDIANGEGIRTSLFVSGCKFHCKDCFNPETQDFDYGQPYTDNTGDIILNSINNNIDGLSILGGDPLWQDNFGLYQLITLCQRVHKKNKTIWIWSGFMWEMIFPRIQIDDFDHHMVLQQMLIKNCDVFVDGQFEADKRDLRLQFRGSSNQRVINIQKSISKGSVCLWAGLKD